MGDVDKTWRTIRDFSLPEYSAYLRRLGRADERTRTAYPCSLRVITQVLQGLARACKFLISRRLSLLCLAACCTVLRSRWYQSGINRGIAASRSCSLAHASEARPAPLRTRQQTADSGPLLALDAFYGSQHRRRYRRGLRLGAPS